jgi:hypothetical protein
VIRVRFNWMESSSAATGSVVAKGPAGVAVSSAVALISPTSALIALISDCIDEMSDCIDETSMGNVSSEGPGAGRAAKRANTATSVATLRTIEIATIRSRSMLVVSVVL